VDVLRPSGMVVRLALVGIPLSCALVLTGCAVEVVPTGGKASTAPATATGAHPSSAETATEGESEDPLQYARRSYYDDKITITIGCPTGEVLLDQEDQTVHLTQDCANVTIRAGSINLLAERVGTLVIEENSDFNYVLVRSAEKVQVDADMTDVWWDEGNPGVTVTGFNSTANPNPVKQ
jgi:hypothetical protein